MGRKVTASVLMKLSKRSKTAAMSSTVQQLDELIQEAYKEYRKLKKKDKQLREEHLQGLAESLAKEKKKKNRRL